MSNLFGSGGLDDLLHSRLAEDNYSPLGRLYAQSPSLAFFVAASAYNLFRRSSLPGRFPPPPADSNKVRIVCVSDTHNHLLPYASIPEGDVFIHAGDLTNSGSVDELRLTLDWIRGLPHAHKVLIAGNHDAALADKAQCEQLNFAGLIYLHDETVELLIRGRTLRVFGSPWTPQCGNFAFQYSRRHAAEKWAGIPLGMDVLVTHGPPKSHVDNNGLGCAALLDALWKTRPLVVVCGHIHSGRGLETLKWDEGQRLWESIVTARKVGWCDAVILVCKLGWVWIKGIKRRVRETTILNCAVTGGMRDQLVRNAVALDI